MLLYYCWVSNARLVCNIHDILSAALKTRWTTSYFPVLVKMSTTRRSMEIHLCLYFYVLFWFLIRTMLKIFIACFFLARNFSAFNWNHLQYVCFILEIETFDSCVEKQNSHGFEHGFHTSYSDSISCLEKLCENF
jgi:hypothetical protein